MNKNIIRIAIALPILMGALVLILKLWGDGESTNAPKPESSSVEKPPIAPKRLTHTESSSTSKAPQPDQAMRDDDPVGDLRLEGQVIDEDGNGVGGATIILGSAPPKSATSEDDGSFAFENLVGRRYAVHARSESLVGGPVMVTLSESSDPVVVRMRAGGGITVEVVDGQNQPIVGATVTVPSMRSIEVKTDDAGTAVIRNLPPGQAIVAAQAPGYARGHSLAAIPSDANVLGRQRITLIRGTLLAGVVVDHRGTPLKNARVIARDTGSIMRVQNPKHDGVATNDNGEFQLTVPQGSVQLLAVHDDYPPTTSERITVGDSEVRGIELALEEGASVSGRVVTATGDPVPWPTIRVVSKSAVGRGTHRQTIGGAEGRFEMTGLPKEELFVHGSNQEASSEGVLVDLRSQSRAKNIEITLGITGTIAGIVVDERGEPIAEAQVQAWPDFWDGADIDQLRVRGPAFATSAGDGSFTLRGLPDSKYSLTASRGNDRAGLMNQGVKATTGDGDVRVVLATAATIEGEVRMSDGSTPDVAMVSIGWSAGVPAVKGKFVLRDIAPGAHEITIRGPQFATAYVPNIEVEAGARLDIGTVSVEKGRTLRGTVLSPSGAVVPGAEVVMAQQIISDGSSLTPKDFGTGMDDRLGVRRAITDDDGAFTIYGLGKEASVVAAEHSEHGRSQGIRVASGSADVSLEVELRDVGSVRGTVSVNGTPAPNVQVLIASTEGEAHIVVVTSDERGGFFARRVAVGEHKVSAMLGAAGTASMAATVVNVEADEEAEANLGISEGSIALAVTIRGENDAHIDAAQVFLFQGDVDVKTGADLNAAFLKESAGSKMTFAMAGKNAVFEKVVPGAYSVCVIPINGDMNDPAFAQKLQRHVGEIAVHCGAVEVAFAPEEQAHVAVVPPMKPLPDDE